MTIKLMKCCLMLSALFLFAAGCGGEPDAPAPIPDGGGTAEPSPGTVEKTPEMPPPPP